MAAVVGVVLLTASLASVSFSVSQKKDVAKEVSLRTELHSSASSDPVIITSGGETRTCSACDLLTARRRTKRCTCYTYKDKECVYYCHLDIIWINTPEHIVPYGLSSYPVSLRTKRSVEIDWKWSGASTRRCVCSLLTDPECKSFCTDSRQKGRLPATPKSKKRTAPFYKVDREWILK